MEEPCLKDLDPSECFVLLLTGSMTVCSELRELFDDLDVDHSGVLSLDELSKGLRAQGYSLSDEEIRQLMAEVDVDGNGYVDFDEFMATLIDWSEVMGHVSVILEISSNSTLLSLNRRKCPDTVWKAM